jgi:hypothetical protein
VALYAPSQLKWSERGTQVTLTQETEFPLGDKISLRVDPAAPVEFSLRLRIPGWAATSPAIAINGKPVRFTTQRGFAVVRRRWSAGDTLTFELAQTFRAEPIDELHSNTVALLRGPLVYAELDPHDSGTHHPRLEAFRAAEQPGLFSAASGGRERTYVPFYFVRDETYTMYNEHG